VKGASIDPYRTVVFFAPLTVPYGPERYGQTSLRQRRGIALAQAEEANRRARNDRTEVPLRVVLAYPGDRFAHGPDVAHRIVDLARADETVVGVVGIAQSRASSREAIGILGGAGLPVVVGPVTGDAMVDEALSDSYYQVSPRNDRNDCNDRHDRSAGRLRHQRPDRATGRRHWRRAASGVRRRRHPRPGRRVQPEPGRRLRAGLHGQQHRRRSPRHDQLPLPGGGHRGVARGHRPPDLRRLDGERDIVVFARRAQQLTGCWTTSPRPAAARA
jgi:hypothetical protein